MVKVRFRVRLLRSGQEIARSESIIGVGQRTIAPGSALTDGQRARSGITLSPAVDALAPSGIPSKIMFWKLSLA